MSRKVRLMFKLLTVLVALCIIYAVGYVSGASDTKHVTVPTVGYPITQDPVLLQDAEDLGIDPSNVNLSFSTTLSASDVQDSANLVGVFTPPNTIQIKPGLSKEFERRTVAYEYLHYFWQNMPQAKKQARTLAYQQYYNTHSAFQQATSDYTGTPDIIADERNSTICTVVPPFILTEETNNYCNSYVPNRALLF